MSDRFAIYAFILLTATWGYNWVVIKIALDYSSALDFAVLRSIGAAACLFLMIAIVKTRFLPPTPWRVVLLGLLQTTGFVGLTTWALEFEGAGKTAVLAFTMPFWVLAFAALTLGERIRDWQWLAITFALVGLILLIGPWEPELGTFGAPLAIAAGACWGASAVVSKTIPVKDRWQLLSVTAWQMLFGAIPLVALALLIDRPPIDWTGTYIAALSYNILPANAVAWLFWLYILQRLPAGVTGLSALAIPVVGSAAAWLQLGERPSTVEAAGLVLIMAALTVLSLRGLKRK